MGTSKREQVYLWFIPESNTEVKCWAKPMAGNESKPHVLHLVDDSGVEIQTIQAKAYFKGPVYK